MVWQPAPGRRYGALNQLVGGFSEGYDAMSKWQREHREEQDKQKKREMRARMGALAKAGAEGTTADVGSTVYSNTAGTDHPGRVTQHRTGGRTITRKDWDKFLNDGMSAAIEAGDFAAANQWKDYVQGTQHRGMMQFAGQAMNALQSGDAEGAAQLLNEANQYFPNGSQNVYDIINGQLVMMGIDEETGKPRGDPVVVTPEYIERTLANMQDIEKFLVWQGDVEKRALDKEKFDALQQFRQDELSLKREEMEGTQAYRRDALAQEADLADQRYALDLQRMAVDKEYKTEYLQIQRDEVQQRLKRLEADTATAATTKQRTAAKQASEYTLKAVEDMNESDLALLEAAQVAPADLAVMTAKLAIENPDLPPAEIQQQVMRVIREDAQAAAPATPEEGPRVVGDDLIPRTGETPLGQMIEDMGRALSSPGGALQGEGAPAPAGALDHRNERADAEARAAAAAKARADAAAAFKAWWAARPPPETPSPGPGVR